MKKLQAKVLIILALSVVTLTARGSVESGSALPKPTYAENTMAKADSLFHLKQYTQSFDIYRALFDIKQYSPSMLLKMAYIQEGLGHLAQSMYYLNLYYLATHDQQALTKIEEVAGKNRLEGYAISDTSRFLTFLREHYTLVAAALVYLCLFMISLAFFQKLRQNRQPIVPVTLLVVLVIVLSVHNYFSTNRAEGIISTPATYLMEGPSAGSPVVSIVGEGHRVEILGKKDVWLKVKWIDKEVYLKESEVLPIGI